MLAKLLRQWGVVPGATPPFHGVALPQLERASRNGGIDADRDMRLFRWFDNKRGPLGGPFADDIAIRMRGDDWAFDVGERLAETLIRSERHEQFDIRQLTGFGASRSDLPNLVSIEAMHRADGRPTPATAAEAASLADLVVTRHKGRLDIDYVPQTGAYWLSNEDGSHRMAAAVTAARLLDESVEFPANLRSWKLDLEALERLEREYGVFVVAPGSHLTRLRLDAGKEERFTLVRPPEWADWVPTLLVTREPPGRIPGALGRMVEALQAGGAAMPLSAFLREWMRPVAIPEPDEDAPAFRMA